MRFLTDARAVWGAALLLAPRAVLAVVARGRAQAPVPAVARVLGARHLVQAAVVRTDRPAGWVLAGAAVDAAHAASMVALAALRPDVRRPAAASALVAGSLALAGARRGQSAVRSSAATAGR